MRILGVDPGSRLTGYGCIEGVGNQLLHITHGTLRLASTSGKATVSLEDRLLGIYQGLSTVIQEYRPTVMVVEKVFFAKNAVSSLKLGQARGAVILTGKIHGLKIIEYSPTEVKLAIVGYGRADKSQVAKMVQLLVGQRDFETLDASDGLALALCHAQFQRMNQHASSPYALALQSLPNQRSKKRLSMAESVGISPGQKAVAKRFLKY